MGQKDGRFGKTKGHQRPGAQREGRVLYMAKYLYRARDRQGKLETGMMTAADEDELYRRLKEKNLYLIEAEDALEGKVHHQLPALMLSEFNRELGDMLGAGVTLVRALTILSQEETRKKREREVLSQVLKLVRQGESISDAMEKQTGAFPLLMVNMYRAAETSGNLAQTSSRLAVHYEKEHHMNTRIKGATTYPKILCVMAVLVVIFIMSIILPQLSDLFDSLKELPLPTRILFGISGFIQNHFKLLLLVLLIAAVILFFLGRMPSVKRKRDEWKIKMPVVGQLLKIIYTARFARCLSSLYSAGIPIVSAMQIVKRTIGNASIEGQFDGALSLLREGRSLSEAVASIDGFMKKLSSVIRVGEESGDLGMMLDSLADSFDYESESAVARLIGYMEPLLIVIMAVIIGFIMVAVMLPIYDSYSAIGTNVYY